MKRWKRGLASALSALMLISALPVTALAEEWKGDPPCDVVTYNLGTLDVTVGSDEQAAETAETPYDLFREDGSYTLALEPDAFFPYEVQFSWNGETESRWFMTAEDTVEVGGHVFSVESAVSDPNALTGLSFTVGGQTVTAWPEEKTFTNDGGVAVQSLLPLKEYQVYLDMRGFLPEELKAVKVNAVLSGMSKKPTIKEDDVVLWSRGSESDDFKMIGRDDTMDISSDGYYSSRQDIEMIVGTGHQLDLNNTRYRLRVNLSDPDSLLTAQVRKADGSAEIPVYSTYFSDDGIFQMGVDKHQWETGEKTLLKLDFADEYKQSGLTATVYEGAYDTEEAAQAANTRNITSEILGEEASGYLADYSNSQDLEECPKITMVMTRNGQTVHVQPMTITMYGSGTSFYAWGLYAQDGNWVEQSSGYLRDEYRTKCFYLRNTYPVNGTYCLLMYIDIPGHHDSADFYGLSNVKHAAVGDYQTAEEIQNQPDIKEQLFSRPGYPADYSGGVIFSVLDINNEVHHCRVMTQEAPEEELPSAPRPDSADTYFRMWRASQNESEGILDGYVMSYRDDSYYYNGYQTVFLMNQDGTPITTDKIIPAFDTGSKVTIYAGLDHAGGEAQKSGESVVEFRNGQPIQYSAAAESKGHLKNYWVTFLTQSTGGPKLFVNAANDPDRKDAETGLPVREVYLTPEYDNHHDVFFANIGDEAMENLYVKLENAANVALDGYWTIRDDAPAAAKTLGAFTGTADSDRKNLAKVRLVPAEGGVGAISGTLVIGYNNGNGKAEEVRIKLTGTAGKPSIVTDTLAGGVKYVPYNSVIMTNSMGASDAVQFTVTAGALPEGVELYPNGKLYGVPMQAGTYTFTATAAYSGGEGLSDSKEFTIEILDNTDANVDASTDVGYTVMDRIPDAMTTYTDQVFRSEGAFSTFYKVFLDGEELVPGVDYTAEEGSTRITVQAQTFRKKGNGKHTFAVEFRTDKNDTSTVKKSAQNYTLNASTTIKPTAPSTSTKPSTPDTSNKPKTTADIFRDISAQAWYYSDVDWAYQSKLMIGVSSDLYEPYGLISPATVVTVLARMDQVDLTRYAGISDPEIAQGYWYTNAAIWAKETGILPAGEFSAMPPIARAKLAVMLVKYLRSKGVDCTLPAAPVAFADADQMTEEENAAFQVLYQFGIFKGIGEYRMDPQGSTTRAQLAALLHRLSVFVAVR